MRFWTREIIGWLLVVLGLLGFYLSFLFLMNHWIFEAWPMAFIAFMVFRGGIHLVKVAVAARICLQAQEQGTGAAPAPAPPAAPASPPRRPLFGSRRES